MLRRSLEPLVTSGWWAHGDELTQVLRDRPRPVAWRTGRRRLASRSLDDQFVVRLSRWPVPRWSDGHGVSGAIRFVAFSAKFGLALALFWLFVTASCVAEPDISEAASRHENPKWGILEPWEPGMRHPVFPHVTASSEKGRWIPNPGYRLIHDDYLSTVWVAGTQHPEYPDFVTTAQEGAWAHESGRTILARPRLTADAVQLVRDDRSTVKPTAERPKEPAEAAVSRRVETPPDAPYTASQREYAALARVASMPWIRGRDLYPKNESPLTGLADALSSLSIDSRMAGAAARFAAVGVVLEAGFRGPKLLNLATLDLDVLLDTFARGYRGEIPITPASVTAVLKDGVAGAVFNWLGHFVFARGIKLHEWVWQHDLLPEARRVADSTDLGDALKVSICLSASEATTGLRLENASGRRLLDVTVSVTSAVGGSASPYGSYFVFLPQWSPGSMVFLPPPLVWNAISRTPGTKMDRAVRVELRSRSGSMPPKTFGTSDAAYQKILRKSAFTLQLK